MSKIIKKGLKPLLIKYMALLMGICYLANPMHRQITSVFHEISHLLESPETVLTHPQVGNHSYDGHEDSDHGDHHNTSVEDSTREGNGHKGDVHKNRAHNDNEHHLANANADHHHDMLDLLDYIFEASDEQHPEDDTALILIKYDKHISSQESILPRKFSHTTFQNFIAMEQKVRIGHLFHPEEPPQQTSA